MFTAEWHGQLTDNSYTKTVTTPAPQLIAWKASLAGAKDTGWKPMLLYAVAALRWVRGSAVRMTFGYRSTRRRAM
jgi:hypothetical protein